MKIYISGKITGDRRYKAKFREVEKKLAAADPMSLVQETFVAECVHCWLVVLSVVILFLWKSVWSWALWLVYNLLGNVSFILIQRYNRPRLLRLAEKENKKRL